VNFVDLSLTASKDAIDFYQFVNDNEQSLKDYDNLSQQDQIDLVNKINSEMVGLNPTFGATATSASELAARGTGHLSRFGAAATTAAATLGKAAGIAREICAVGTGSRRHGPVTANASRTAATIVGAAAVLAGNARVVFGYAVIPGPGRTTGTAATTTGTARGVPIVGAAVSALKFCGSYARARGGGHAAGRGRISADLTALAALS
jgi:hypothetical protein